MFSVLIQIPHKSSPARSRIMNSLLVWFPIYSCIYTAGISLRDPHQQLSQVFTLSPICPLIPKTDLPFHKFNSRAGPLSSIPSTPSPSPLLLSYLHSADPFHPRPSILPFTQLSTRRLDSVLTSPSSLLLFHQHSADPSHPRPSILPLLNYRPAGWTRFLHKARAGRDNHY